MYMHTQHLRSIEIYSGDSVGEDRSRNRREYKFYILRADGRYVFKVRSYPTYMQVTHQWQIFIYQKRIIRIYGHEGRALIRVFIAFCQPGSKIRLEQDHLCLE